MIFLGIPFFKNINFLEDTLLSLLAQNSSHWHAVVLDDSLESEEAIKAENLVKKLSDHRIEYKKNIQNIGMANNWNQALDLGQNYPNAIATVILHADDRLMPEYVSEMLIAIKNNPNTVAFFCEAAVIDGNGKRSFSFTDFYKKILLPKKTNGIINLNGIDGIRSLIPGNFIFCPTLCYRNSLLSRRFDPKLKMVTDFELTLDLLMQGFSLQGLYPHPLFEYRRHDSNTTQLMNQNLERFKEETALYLSLAKKLDEKKLYPLAKKARELNIIKKNLIFLIITSLLKGKFSLMNRYFVYLLNLIKI